MAKGIMILGLAADEVNLLRVAMARKAGYEIWTCNDFWTAYPELKPDRAYQIHKGADEHVDEFGVKRNVAAFEEYCKKLGVKDIISNLSPESYAWYFGKQPKFWYQSTINYMFVDAWRLIEKGVIGPHIILEGMPFIGTGERQIQKALVISAVEMSIHRGINVDAAHWKQWHEEASSVDWSKLMDHKVYGLSTHDMAMTENMVRLSLEQTEININQ